MAAYLFRASREEDPTSVSPSWVDQLVQYFCSSCIKNDDDHTKQSSSYLRVFFHFYSSTVIQSLNDATSTAFCSCVMMLGHLLAPPVCLMEWWNEDDFTSLPTLGGFSTGSSYHIQTKFHLCCRSIYCTPSSEKGFWMYRGWKVDLNSVQTTVSDLIMLRNVQRSQGPSS